MNQNEMNCTVYFNPSNGSTLLSQEEILSGLESTSIPLKIASIKSAILVILDGQTLPKVLMHVIRFCSTNTNAELKKLSMIFWEVVPKYDKTSKKLLPEMILVCNALLNDLNSANEFIRGSMLRFLCKINEMEIIEPLKDAIIANLQHRHSYVRRNAVMTVYTMYKNFGEKLIPDAPELMEAFIDVESDMNARKNAFLMLFDTAQEKAVLYLMKILDQVAKFGDGFSMVILELTRKVCHQDPTQKSRFVRCIFSLLHSNSAAVSYEAAWTLITLSNAPTAVRAAAKTYAGLLLHSDNNLKLIVLDRLADLKKYHSKVLQEIMMDVMRVLSSPSLVVCEKVLDITMDLISPRNIEEVIQLLKREVIKTQEKNMDKRQEYRALLISAIRRCAIKFPETAHQVVHLLMDFLNAEGALEVMQFVRVMCESYPELRAGIVNKLILSLSEITRSPVFRIAFWVLAEYAESYESLVASLACMQTLLGPLPLTNEKVEKKENGVPVKTFTKRSVVLPDGTYGTEIVDMEEDVVDEIISSKLRILIVGGNFFVAAALASAFLKMGLRLQTMGSADAPSWILQSLIMLSAIVAFGESSLAKLPIDEDSKHRIYLAIKILATSDAQQNFGEIITTECRALYGTIVSKEKEKEAALLNAADVLCRTQVDNVLAVRQLAPRLLGVHMEKLKKNLKVDQ